jgi:hypothetical protein
LQKLSRHDARTLAIQFGIDRLDQLVSIQFHCISPQSEKNPDTLVAGHGSRLSVESGKVETRRNAQTPIVNCRCYSPGRGKVGEHDRNHHGAARAVRSMMGVYPQTPSES